MYAALGGPDQNRPEFASNKIVLRFVRDSLSSWRASAHLVDQNSNHLKYK